MVGDIDPCKEQMLMTETFPSHDPPMVLELVAGGCLIWYIFIIALSTTGFVQIQRNYSSHLCPSASTKRPLSNAPHLTILRPVKGLEPHLYECLAATFHQTYPRERLTIYLCISSRNDPAFPILQRLLSDFSAFDAKILIEEEDPNLSGHHGKTNNLGPNPKIRNMSRGYREAKGDIVWIIDCNVWVNPDVAGLMVDHLCGFTPSNPGRKYKFAHQLPLSIDVKGSSSFSTSALLPFTSSSQLSSHSILSLAGGRLEELFLSTSHAKFYTAITIVAIAPCVVGKSNMFRRSHLNALTNSHPTLSPGIDFFSNNICEDHLIGDLLWRSPLPPSILFSASEEGNEWSSPTSPTKGITESAPITTWGNHILLPFPPAIQPTSHLSLSSYLSRRTRWLRVRKFTVVLATLVEPGTESILCSLHGAFALTTLPLVNSLLGIPRTWTAFLIIWTMNMIVWVGVDWLVWKRLQGRVRGEGGPEFGRGLGRVRWQWFAAWIGREILALPIWIWAVVGGMTVTWRGRRYRAGMDLRVREVWALKDGEKVRAD
ncbi:hypothetical protein MMC12_001274 [Toensbergia leucococca]|nr:hypothetical protein [Toensbergia leucococca]